MNSAILSSKRGRSVDPAGRSLRWRCRWRVLAVGLTGIAVEAVLGGALPVARVGTACWSTVGWRCAGKGFEGRSRRARSVPGSAASTGLADLRVLVPVALRQELQRCEGVGHGEMGRRGSAVSG